MAWGPQPGSERALSQHLLPPSAGDVGCLGICCSLGEPPASLCPFAPTTMLGCRQAGIGAQAAARVLGVSLLCYQVKVVHAMPRGASSGDPRGGSPSRAIIGEPFPSLQIGAQPPFPALGTPPCRRDRTQLSPASGVSLTVTITTTGGSATPTQGDHCGPHKAQREAFVTRRGEWGPMRLGGTVRGETEAAAPAARAHVAQPGPCVPIRRQPDGAGPSPSRARL